MPTLYDMIKALPDGYAGEILSGVLYVNPRPAVAPTRAGSNLDADIAYLFGRAHGGAGGWRILDEPEVHFVLDIEVSGPDIAGWRRERMPELPAGHRFTGVPYWVCMIASPSWARTKRSVKMSIDAEFGVCITWLVDPTEQLVETFENIDGQWQSLGRVVGKHTIHLPPSDAVGLYCPWVEHQRLKIL